MSLLSERRSQYVSVKRGAPALNAQVFIEAYQCRTESFKYHIAVGAQAFCNWRTAWLVECMDKLPRWTPLPVDKGTDIGNIGA